VNEELGALDVPLGEVATPAAAAAAWELLDRVEVGTLILDPATAGPLLAAAPPTARPWWQGIVWLWRPGPQSQPPSSGHLGGWQRRWLAVPEVSSFVGSECPLGGLHVERAFEPSVEGGELVLGPLHPGVPWRYRTGLQVRSLASCRCGDPSPATET
jgi:hypothetical protein